MLQFCSDTGEQTHSFMRKVLMEESDEEQSSIPGKVPEFGAIFMSNDATKTECFRRKLFGLPMGQANFVKRVKAGMILFLFEFERRELHGVFQACTDGAINIVPLAYSSSGMQFPAQVKFTQIWFCSPLSENEFRDTIRENYFSANKFNFGLSERQVRKLLLLFSSRKLKDKSYRRQFTRSNVARPIRHSRNKARSAVDNGSFVMIDGESRKQDERNTDGSFGSVISTKYARDCINKNGGIVDDDQFASTTVENGHRMDREFGPLSSNELLGAPLGKVGRLVGDGQFVASNVAGNRRDIGMEPRLVINNYLGPSFDASKRHLEDVSFATSYVLQNKCNESDGLGSHVSTEHPGLFESILPEHYSKASLKENLLINDRFRQSPIVLRMVERQNSSFSSLAPHEDAMPSSNVSYSSSYGNAAVTRSFQYDPDVASLDDGRIVSHVSNVPPFPYNPDVHSRHPASVAANVPALHYDPDVPSRHLASLGANVPALPYNPKLPSLNCRRSASFADTIPGLPYDPDVPSLNYRSSASHAAVYPMSQEGNTKRMDYHGNTMNSDIYQNSERMYSDQKNRKSVFYRISQPPEAFEQDCGTYVGDDIDSSVDEVMSILQKSHYQWVKGKSFKQVIKRHDKVPNSGNEKQMMINSKLLKKDHLLRSSNEMNLDGISGGEENGVQKAEGITFLDFKRKSKVRKMQDDAIIRDHTESAGLPAGKHKRRKLIRPKFSENESFGDAMVGSLAHENKEGQNVELPDAMLCINHLDKNKDAERGSKCEEEKDESCELSLRNADEERKDASPDAGIENMPFLVPCEESKAEESLSLNNSEVVGLSQHHGNPIYSILLEAFLESCKEKAEPGVACGGLGRDIDNGKNLSQSVGIVDTSRPLSSEIVSGSTNDNTETEKVPKELGNGEENIQKLFLESVTGQCKAPFETIDSVSCSNMKDSSQEIYEANDRCGEAGGCNSRQRH